MLAAYRVTTLDYIFYFPFMLFINELMDPMTKSATLWVRPRASLRNEQSGAHIRNSTEQGLKTANEGQRVDHFMR